MAEPSDYKFLCFSGEPKVIEVHRERGTVNHTQDFMWADWTPTNISQPGVPCGRVAPAKPGAFNEMISLSRVLAKGIPHVRVDWYCINQMLRFGEMTFYDGAGFEPFTNGEDDRLLGSFIELDGV